MIQQLANISFATPWAFLLLLLAPLVWWLWYKRRDKRYPHIRMSTLEAVKNSSNWKVWMRKSLVWMRALALLALVVALARPQLTEQEESIKAEGISIALAMDLSSSMLAQDFKPNRLEESKRVAIDFVKKRPYDSIAIVAFAGEAYTLCPLTTDYNMVRTHLAGLACGTLTDGTAIGQGLATAINRIKDSKIKSKVIILLTDGVNTAGYLSPDRAAQIAKEFGIKVYTIGVGSRGEALTPVSKDRFGRYRYGVATVEIDENLLQQIAQLTDGKYFRATSAEELEGIYEQIDQLEKTEIEVTVIKRYQEKFRFFALIAAFLLLLELICRYTILRAIP